MSRIGFKNDYCWVVMYHTNNTQQPIVFTSETRYNALDYIFPELVKKIKKKYPRVTWEETNLDKLKNNKITEYEVRVSGNPNVYVKAFRSSYIECLEDNYKLV